MKRTFENLAYLILMMSALILMTICLMTPDKTNDGYFTDIVRYWTDNQYYCDNFNPNYCKGIKP